MKVTLTQNQIRRRLKSIMISKYLTYFRKQVDKFKECDSGDKTAEKQCQKCDENDSER